MICYDFTLLQDQKDNTSPNQELETAILKTKDSTKSLKKQLQDTAMDQASDVFKTNEVNELGIGLRSIAPKGLSRLQLKQI